MSSKLSKDMEQNTSVLLESSFFPECWTDDRRMGVLLAEFRPRQLNSVSYDTKMKFWKDLIMSYCKAMGSSVVSISMLKECFRRKNTVPHCLQTVVDDMLAKEELIREKQLLENQSGSTFSVTSWMLDIFVKKPLKLGYETVRATVLGSTNNDESTNFIAMPVARLHANMVEEIVNNNKLYNKVMSLDELSNLINQSSKLMKTGLQPALILLSQSNRLTIETVKHGENKTVLIKFASPSAVAQPITQIEQSIFELELSELQLMKDINAIESNINQTMTQAREYVRNGQKQMAKTSLKKKHMLEKNMQQKISALENLQEMLFKIHNIQSDKNVLEAYKLGSTMLKKAFENAGITLEHVDETLAEMKEVLTQHDEVLTMIGAVSVNDVDELELEQELGDLIDMKLAENKIDVTGKLPSPTMPIIDPAIPSSKKEDFDEQIEKRLAALRVDSSEVHKLVDQKM
ncbi:charged multivesicular body protein 7 [Anopheles nili]|uniref:charged multivesicular body protein 7 n=1 Tax=Anopheles nili TaxID=185578 RepID=UPI00237C2A0D|nr:charged multivesicular body protein 7 [Anopheles nili]